MCEIRIGTSGWQYKHWRGPFYPKKTPAAQMFPFYVDHFDTVEVNNSFYRLPKPETFAAWRDAVPSDFRFAVKGSRFITHNKKLKDPEPALERLMPAVDTLKRKLGPVLFQLPPKWQVNLERFAAFLTALPSGHRYAFEFRNETWNTREVFDLLRKHKSAYCIFHLAGFQSPLEVTANFAYVRLHGPGGKYQGSYDDAALREWAARIRTWRRRLKAIYVYFDNDQAGYAAQDALRLRGMVKT
ncbi:MAG TPA: DUF72 domain-containing protein [Bryobacteraceae bacterium]|nr:DUF72 domain-containing protein [Bryobacteraceae bacterium]